jgi:GNAT superfamily N-acetyltransferase
VRIKFGGHGHQLVLWETISWTGNPVEIIEIRDGRGLRIAWAELFYEQGDRAVAKEFYVWPDKRRRGYGTLLEDLCAERARIRRSRELIVWFHEHDAFLHVRRAGREFGQQRGYEWRWTSRIPRVVALGRKAL